MGKIPYLNMGTDRIGLTLRAWIVNQIAINGRTPSFLHWLTDADSKGLADFIRVIEGDINTIAYGYIALWYIGQVSYLAVDYQIVAMRKLWEILLPFRKYLGNH